MCLIEIKKSPKPVVACAMNAKSTLGPGIEVFTNSPLVKKSRESIMEFLLLNHPLDCPICDQGGECDLQDQSLFFGFTKKRFYSLKRVVSEKNLGPIIKTVMTRCIHCTRCVRFAHEIAGVGDLGMFGRGLNSEIGTYVDKIFQSELSGNMIDICPVGALTSKAYPFNHRSWELRTVKSIDFSDGFGLNIQIMLKNYNIIRILPDMSFETVKNSWISDKTRFSFDGIMVGSKKNEIFNLTPQARFFEDSGMIKLDEWDSIIRRFILSLYFQDHLTNHLFKEYPLVFISNDQTPMEILSLVLLLSKKYTFIKLKALNKFKISADLESSFKINDSLTKKKFRSTDNCLLINSNSRFESTHWNLKLRQRYLKGNFKVFSTGPKSDLTVPTEELGLNSRGIKSVSEGKHLVNLNFCNEKTVVVCSAGVLRRNDGIANKKVLELISKNTGYCGVFDLLVKDINFVGLNSIGKLKHLGVKDFINFWGIYLLESSLKNFNINKLMKLKQLDYYFTTTDRNNSRLLINQNYIDNNKQHLQTAMNLLIKKKFNVNNYTHMPSKTFFETPVSYINAEGLTKEVSAGIALINNSKTSWNILRKIFFDIKRVTLIKNPLQNNRIFFDNKSFYRFKDYVKFTSLTSRELCKSSSNKYHYKSLTVKHDLNNFKKVNLLKLTNFKKMLEDFYMDGEDNYTKNSYTMTICSKFLRLVSSNIV